jgi:hypothetical protein
MTELPSSQAGFNFWKEERYLIARSFLLIKRKILFVLFKDSS